MGNDSHVSDLRTKMESGAVNYHRDLKKMKTFWKEGNKIVWEHAEFEVPVEHLGGDIQLGNMELRGAQNKVLCHNPSV